MSVYLFFVILFSEFSVAHFEQYLAMMSVPLISYSVANHFKTPHVAQHVMMLAIYKHLIT